MNHVRLTIRTPFLLCRATPMYMCRLLWLHKSYSIISICVPTRQGMVPLLNFLCTDLAFALIRPIPCIFWPLPAKFKMIAYVISVLHLKTQTSWMSRVRSPSVCWTLAAIADTSLLITLQTSQSHNLPADIKVMVHRMPCQLSACT